MCRHPVLITARAGLHAEAEARRGCYRRLVTASAQLARLEAQRAYFASDERLHDRAAAWLDASSCECLVAVHAACEEAAFFLARLEPAALDRALAPTPLPRDTEQLLEQLWNSRRR
jgi:hypothetical protein